MSPSISAQRVASVREFNRLYTQRIGILNKGLLDSSFSLTEARVLYELAHRERPLARNLERDLGLDPGYLSRILRRFQASGLIARTTSPRDHRRSELRLTAAGRAEFVRLDERSRDSIDALLRTLPESGQSHLVASMQTIGRLLGPQASPRPAYRLRSHRPGDMGWVASRHGAVYAEEYGWDGRFEALVAEIVANFINNFHRDRERCWIAELGGEPAGSIFLVKQSDTIGQLRLLLVEPTARGLGIGHRLVDECVRFARETGYQKVTLWTQSILIAARHIYAAAGFRLLREEAHRSFGHDLIGENWELIL